MDIVYHYPPELLALLVDTIPLLCRSKRDVIVFLRGAGVEQGVLQDLDIRVQEDRQNIHKYEIARTVLTRLNEKGEATLRERRQVLRRVTEFEDFSTCWPSDQLKAKGLVAEIRRVVNVKDSFTRMAHERDQEHAAKSREYTAKVAAVQAKKRELQGVRNELSALFGEEDPHGRGKRLEDVLNKLFGTAGILVRESFTRSGEKGEGVLEQVDGVIELDGEIYLVEMKWLKTSVSVNDVSRHLMRVFLRGSSRGIFLSTTPLSTAALTTCKEALQKAVIVVCLLEEIVRLLEKGEDLAALFREKIRRAIVDKDPFYKSL